MMYGQDDPKKCTAVRLVRFGLARRIHKVRAKTLLLNPFAERRLTPRDGRLASSITGVDCSWKRAREVFESPSRGMHRKLPPLLAGNPTNYSKIGDLTTVEAVSAALFILGRRDDATELLSKFRWGHTFLALNESLLEEYSSMHEESEVDSIAREYGLVRTTGQSDARFAR